MMFTQFKLPDGRHEEVHIDVSQETERLARIIVSRGFNFECEILRTEEVYLDCCNKERQLASIIRGNGPGMARAVEELAEMAYRELTRGEP